NRVALSVSGDRDAARAVEGNLVSGLNLRAADDVIYCAVDSDALLAVWKRSGSRCIQSDKVSLNDIPDSGGEETELNADRISRNDVSRFGNKAANHMVVRGDINDGT